MGPVDSGWVWVSFVTMYLTGSGSVNFTLGSSLWGSDLLTNITVPVSGNAWYNISFPEFQLEGGTPYFLNVYLVTGSVGWGWTQAVPVVDPPGTVIVNTIANYFLTYGNALASSTTAPNLYSVGGTADEIPTYLLTFTETGLPYDTPGGSVSIPSYGSEPFVGGVASFMVPTGSYTFTITAPACFAYAILGPCYQFVSSNPTTSVTVTEAGGAVTVLFEEVTTTWFFESGLASSGFFEPPAWSVNVNGPHESLPLSLTSFLLGLYLSFECSAPVGLGIIPVTEPNGTYTFTVPSITGYNTPSPASGPLVFPYTSPSCTQIIFQSLSDIYAFTNSILPTFPSYPLPESQGFAVTPLSPYVNFVQLYLTGSGVVCVTLTTAPFGGSVLASTDVDVTGAGWYYIPIGTTDSGNPYGTIQLSTDTPYYINAYLMSGPGVSWGYTTTFLANSLNTLDEYFCVPGSTEAPCSTGATVASSNDVPNLYAVGDSPLYSFGPAHGGLNAVPTLGILAEKSMALWTIEQRTVVGPTSAPSARSGA